MKTAGIAGVNRATRNPRGSNPLEGLVGASRLELETCCAQFAQRTAIT